MRIVLSNKPTSRLAVTALMGMLLATGALAQSVAPSGSDNGSSSNGSFSAEISTGVEYDSNISVIELDIQTTQDDFAVSFDFGVSAETDIGENTEIKGGYNFGQDIQFDLSAFDTQSHRLSTEISHDFGEVDTGVSYQFVYSRLGGAGFLSMHRVSPYLATYVADKKAYIRGSYIYTEKNFIGRVDRDSLVNAASAEVFYFLNGLTTYIAAGYRYEAENASSAEFDFKSHNLKLRLSQRVPIFGKTGKFRIGWRYEDRNYRTDIQPTFVLRNDQRHRFSASLEIPISEMVYTEFEYRYDDFSSTRASADFTQSVAAIRIGGRI